MDETVTAILLTAVVALVIALAAPRLDVTVEQLFEDLW